MNSLIFALVILGGQGAHADKAVAQQSAKQVTIQYAQTTIGRNVTITLDGKNPQPEFAGKLGFRDRDSSWTSVCADVRSPINPGAYFSVFPQRSEAVGGHIQLAGNIVAKYFKAATSADQCAGLQIAVWEAIEDGGAKPDFQAGHFSVKATPAVLKLAEQYYDAIDEPGNVLYLQTGPGGNRGGSGQGQLLL